MDHASVGSLQIGGPYTVTGSATDTPSRRRIFVCAPRGATEEQACASMILSRFARLAYRRPATSADVRTLLEFFDRGRREGQSFDAGIQFALERALVDPDFLLRVYRDPTPTSGVVSGSPTSPSSASDVVSDSPTSPSSTSDVVSGSPTPPSSTSDVVSGFSRTVDRRVVNPLSDVEVASRLSFFLWGSAPDEGLLDLAERGQLTRPAILEQQVRRMMADPRATKSLVDGFAAQWLNLRRVEEVVVDPDRYPNYDESLLQAFKEETELFLASTLREDRSVVDLLKADYTFVNERLARHYGIPGVYGSRFRRVTLPNQDQRGGLLGNGALLATTSYPDRTSPVLRGKWLLNNIFGLPVPPPPPGVDTTLTETKAGAAPATIRERLAQHRKDPSCASCHSVIDPLGFALENFDVIGGWRTVDESGQPVDATGTTASGSKVTGLAGLRALLLEQPDQFPRTVTEKLLAYALGRRVEYYDRPAVRRIVREASAENYRWSSLILGIVKSPGFLTRASSVN
jgi:hypothetical protein